MKTLISAAFALMMMTSVAFAGNDKPCCKTKCNNKEACTCSSSSKTDKKCADAKCAKKCAEAKKCVCK